MGKRSQTCDPNLPSSLSAVPHIYTDGGCIHCGRPAESVQDLAKQFPPTATPAEPVASEPKKSDRPKTQDHGVKTYGRR